MNGRQSDHLCEQTVRQAYVAQTGQGAAGFTVHASRIRITEVGIMVSAVDTVTTIPLILRQRTSLGPHDATVPTNWTTAYDIDTAFDLDAVGVSIWRPKNDNVQADLSSTYTESISSKKVIQAQVRSSLTGTSWTGYLWIKYLITDKELYT